MADPNESKDVVWVIYDAGHDLPIDVVAQREDGDTLSHEVAEPYISVRAISSAIAATGGPDDDANAALTRLMNLLGEVRSQ